MPAWARVRRRHEHEARREDRGPLAADDRDAPVLQRLAQRLERCARELAELVEEEDAVVGEGGLARRRSAAAAHQAGRGDRVVWRAERALLDESRRTLASVAAGLNSEAEICAAMTTMAGAIASASGMLSTPRISTTASGTV